MFIPYRTDAPLYHWPFATVGVIAACVTLSVAGWMEWIDVDPLLLHYDAFTPHQWVTSNLLHAGPVHLIGNMIFLWVFGLIVEGKVGWLRFLGIVLALGVPQCAIEQLIFTHGVRLGASAIVFGLMGISLIWAPENEVEVAWVMWLRAGTFEARVRTVAVCFALWESGWLVLLLLANGFRASSEFLHLMGFALGVPLAVWMLRRGLVNCEGWDWFSVRRGDHRRGVVGGWKRADAIRRAARAPSPSPEQQQESLAALRSAIVDGDGARAEAAWKRLRQPLERVDLFGLCDLLVSARRWDRAAELLSEVRRRFPDAPPRLTLRRAQIAIRHEDRPAAAADLLETMATDRLSPTDARDRARLLEEARRAAAETPLELCGDPL